MRAAAACLIFCCGAWKQTEAGDPLQTPGATFRDCPTCPEMVVLPPGRYMMGTRDGKAGTGPRHEVIIGYRFAMSRYEIMFDEWHACRSTRARTREPDDHGWGQGPRPVINISWEDAQQYVDHLSRLTGKPYRLPSEAEWEYGCGPARRAAIGGAMMSVRTAPTAGSVAANGTAR